MISQLYMAATATLGLQKNMNMIADNLVNVQTVAFKSRRMEFENMFPQVFERVLYDYRDPSESEELKSRRTVSEYGQGAKVAEITRNMTQGTIEVTNRDLDVAIEGLGYFQVRLPDGRIGYTRAGNFHRDADGNVLTGNGYPLEPPIQIPRDTSVVTLGTDGRMFGQTDVQSIPREIGRFTLALFRNEEGLRAIGGNLYVDTATSGPPELGEPNQDAAGRTRQGALEFSNVNLIEQLVELVIVQRMFEVNVKSIRAADEILKEGGGMK